MTTVTGLTADRMLQIEAASVVDGDVDASGNLILTKHDGSKINAGPVIGPTGPQGPIGQDLSVLSAQIIREVGQANQIKAGRQLSVTDFTTLGLSAPAGLWNLSNNLSDASGNGRDLLVKGGVPYSTGINGLATTCMIFTGSTGQGLYIPDAGTNDSFRLRSGSIGCWFKTAKRATFQMLIDKYGTANQQIYSLHITDTNVVRANGCPDGVANNLVVTGITDVADERWHFVVATFDASTYRIYLDGILESTAPGAMLFSGTSAFNVGARGADSSNNAVFPHFGKIDEPFVTADVLSEDQIRNLYCAKIAHTLGAVPKRASISVRRQRRGAALVTADFPPFPASPLRLYNFSAGALVDEGSNATNLINGSAVAVAAPDGSNKNAFNFNGTTNYLGCSDTGLVQLLNSRSYGCWLKTISTVTGIVLSWGTQPGGHANIYVFNGTINSSNGADALAGPYIADGQWHFVVVTETNTPSDGIKRKLYVDGKLVGTSLVLASLVLAGADRFRVATNPDGSSPFAGQIDTVFVCGDILTMEQINTLYAKSSQALGPSPKNVGDHIEVLRSADVLTIFDTLDSNSQVDLAVA